MKKLLKLSAVALVIAFYSCEKSSVRPDSVPPVYPSIEKNGPYGSVSNWKSIGGDTIFSDTLTLTYFYTETNKPCNTCYYQQNISFWNDYDYTLAVPECATPTDTLIFTDIDSGRKAIFTKIN